MPSDLTIERVEELERLLETATQGKWRREAQGGSSTVLTEGKPARNDTGIPPYGYDERNGHCLAYPFRDGNQVRWDFVCFSHEDAALIAQAVNALPALLTLARTALEGSPAVGGVRNPARAQAVGELVEAAKGGLVALENLNQTEECRGAQIRLSRALAAVGSPNPPSADALKVALSTRAYVLTEPVTPGWRVIVGFETLEGAQAAHDAIAKVTP